MSSDKDKYKFLSFLDLVQRDNDAQTQTRPPFWVKVVQKRLYVWFGAQIENLIDSTEYFMFTFTSEIFQKDRNKFLLLPLWLYFPKIELLHSFSITSHKVLEKNIILCIRYSRYIQILNVKNSTCSCISKIFSYFPQYFDNFSGASPCW